MAIYVDSFRLPRQQVTVTDGIRQITFDTPDDLLMYLDRHPDERDWFRESSWYIEPGRR